MKTSEIDNCGCGSDEYERETDGIVYSFFCAGCGDLVAETLMGPGP